MTLGIYVQVPFCQTKCTYCNFHTGAFSASLYSPYAEAVCREVRNYDSLLRAARVALPDDFSSQIVDTIYLGGGTPSLLDPSALACILGAIRERFSTALNEVTLEADPETITSAKASAWKAAGFTRISLGVQSFDDRELQSAGRMHRRADVFSAHDILRSAGFDNLSFDLIAGLPHQSRETSEDSLSELLRLRPEHVSVYLMEIDEGSRLGKEVLAGGKRYSAEALPSDDAMAEFYESACERLSLAGYQHYEISNWALPEHESRHNLKYWKREPYLGFGAGAHSFSGVERWANAHEPAAYVASLARGVIPLEQLERVTPQQALDEEIFLGLRQLQGIDLDLIQAKYNPWFRGDLRGKLADLESQGLVESDGARVRLAPARLAVSNEVFVALMD